LEFCASSEGIDKNLSKKKSGRRNKKNTDIKIRDTKMTHKELLFKMAEKKMLTLSAHKDGRGLFWAGMDNMEALEKPFDLGDFDVIDTHEDIYGESDNYEEVPVKDKQGRIIAPFNTIR